MNTHLIARFSNGILLLIRQLVSRRQILIVWILFLLLELLVLEFNWTKLEHRLFEAFCIQDVLSSIMLRNTWPDSSLEVFNYLLLVKWLRFWLMLWSLQDGARCSHELVNLVLDHLLLCFILIFLASLDVCILVSSRFLDALALCLDHILLEEQRFCHMLWFILIWNHSINLLCILILIFVSVDLINWFGYIWVFLFHRKTCFTFATIALCETGTVLVQPLSEIMWSYVLARGAQPLSECRTFRISAHQVEVAVFFVCFWHL